MEVLGNSEYCRACESVSNSIKLLIGSDNMNNFACGDAQIREALLRRKKTEYARNKDVIVVEELGLAHAKSRIDIAVINGDIHGYEIKSDRDTLARLPNQLDIYRKTLQRLTIVCSNRYIEQVEFMVPEWVGLIEVHTGPRGGISLCNFRRAKSNPDIDIKMVAHLLWRNEAVRLLSRYMPEKSLARKRRADLYQLIAERYSSKDLVCEIRRFMAIRVEWKDRLVPRSYDD